MTVAERARALEAVGLTPRQAQFLGLAALVSGHCLRRQYQAFAQVPAGLQVRRLLDDLVAHRWAARLRFRADRAHVYHLSAKPLYAVLGDVDNRHRRPANAVAIARKLMLLDAVLALPDHVWYATEADKVTLFDELGVDRRCVPTRRYDPVTGRRDNTPTRRAFVDKLPIGVSGAPPVVTFLFLTTDPQAGAFGRFLHEYAPLFAALPQWRVRVVFPPALKTHTGHVHAFHAWHRAASTRAARVDVCCR
jgi:DNA-directed RNA polymerase subunit N (RpoN/RPB10)